ncbi:nucleoside phosphorylase [Anaerocolumna aminovalerica]|uniref:nucleoside phosphorylase n=1 Tax=Anaerocolumna aminovalerica TaxID=1527 RepID=UPI000BE30014|nr:nucleoside phosphorylase [Anaerocolumna aminovalerica]MBU5334405.1 nucleoside phosphorylase [Anaerocolumna aminovalerica]
MINKDQLMHHIKCKVGDVGKYVLLPGDPGRVSKIAAYLDDAKHVQTNREYEIWTGYLEGEKVSVMSTGMGGPSAAIGLEELKMIGADTFIRIGTCGGIDPSLEPGTLIIPTGAIRKDGTGKEYVPIEFPAVPDFELVTALKAASDKLGYTNALGIVECKDSYYGQHSPERMPVKYELQQKWEAWKMAGAIGSEMESSTLFIVSSVLRVRCATVLLLCRNREREDSMNTGLVRVTEIAPAIETAVNALRNVITNDKKIK